MLTVVNLFMQLVKIPSPLYKVGEIQRFLLNFFNNLSPNAEIIIDSAGREHPEFETGNMLINIPASPGLENLPTLAVEAHIDTVKEEKMINPVLDLIEGKITSDGTTILGADDKAGIAAICMAAQVINNFPHGPIQIIFSVGEESSMYGMRGFDFSAIKATSILCVDGFQPTSIINACAGKIKYRATFYGKSAHGAEPEKSVNAIYLAARAVSNCMAWNLTGRLGNGVIHNISEVQSHEGISEYPSNNTIPGTCSIAGELRGLDEKLLNGVFETAKSFMEEDADKYSGSVRFETLIPYKPFRVSEGAEIINRLKNNNPDKLFTCESCDGSTHSNIFNERGFESVVIGAGCRNPHAHDEYLVISELEEAAEIITRYLLPK